MPKFHQIIEHHWQSPNPLLSCLLRPLSLVFARIAAKRRAEFLSGKRASGKLSVPVVVVGNIHTGGAGKTPVVAALVSGLQKRGIKAGIISRGYGRKTKNACVLDEHSCAEETGDEPLLLYRKTGVPVAVAAKRIEAGRALLAAHPDLDIIIADDGLQHYALQRDMEIVVFPFADVGRKDLDLLPNGSLREPLSRLKTVDCMVVSGCADDAEISEKLAEHIFRSKIVNGKIYNLNNPNETLDLCRLKNQTAAAAAGIAKPERFFQSLATLGIKLAETVALSDHAAISAQDLPQADAVFITEKDAVKLENIAQDNVWVLPVCAIIEPDLAEFVAERLFKREKI